MVSLGDMVFSILIDQLEQLTAEGDATEAQLDALRWLLQMPLQKIWRKSLSDLGDEILPREPREMQ